jgi:hypothetical protein
MAVLLGLRASSLVCLARASLWCIHVLGSHELVRSADDEIGHPGLVMQGSERSWVLQVSGTRGQRVSEASLSGSAKWYGARRAGICRPRLSVSECLGEYGLTGERFLERDRPAWCLGERGLGPPKAQHCSVQTTVC